MTPIDKAIKALGPFAVWAADFDSIPGEFTDDEVQYTKIPVGAYRAAAQALSDLSSLKLEDGDRQWLVDLRIPDEENDDIHEDDGDARFNARIDRLLAVLGHGEAE